MADNTKIRRPEDPTKININQSWEVEYWTKKFGISASVLTQAVKAVGPMVKNVEKWLHDRGYI